MNTRTILKNYRLITVVLLLAIALLSFTKLSSWAGNPANHQRTVESLDEKRNTVLELMAASAATSTAISLLPGDDATPIAEKLADVSSYFLWVLCAIYLEKYLVTLTGFVAFKVLIPISCLLFGVSLFVPREAVGNWKRMALKLTFVALAIYLIVPVSVKASEIIEETYEVSATLSEDATEDSSEDAAAQDAAETSSDASTDAADSAGEASAKVSEDTNIFLKFVNSAKDFVSNVTEEASSLASDKINELVEKAETVLNHMIESVAIMIVTSCLIPILVLLFFFGIIKAVLQVDLFSPTMALAEKMKLSRLLRRREWEDDLDE